MKRILVTGATGFLGRHVIEALLVKPEGEFGPETLRLLCRNNHPWQGNARVEAIQGDILDPEAVESAVDGVDVVIHLAGRVARTNNGSAALFETHIDGTRNVCRAALKHGRPKILLASSSGTVALSRNPKAHDESAPYALEIAGNWPYYLSKIYQEKLALSYWEAERLPIVILSPSLLLGPGDFNMSSTRDVQLFLGRQVLSIPSGGLNFIDVRDAAAAFLAAMESGQPGRRYLLGGHDMTVREFFCLMQNVTGVRAPLFALPEALARGGSRVLRKGMNLLGREFPVDDVTIEMAYRFWYCDNRRARLELGLEIRPAEETIRDTVAFLRSRAD